MKEKSILEMVGGEKYMNPHYNIKVEKMTDKEIAEEYLKEKLEERKDKFIFELPEVYITDVKQAFLAGLKAGRPQWHDLRKDPNDLPKATTPVLVILESGVPYVSWISSDKGWWFCTNYYTGEDKVIAWKEIVVPKEIK